jgi:hypothetical protein
MPRRPTGKQDGGPALEEYRRKRHFGRTGEPRGNGGHPVPAASAIERGHVTFDLHGSKLLVKSDDEFAGRRRNPVRSQPESVKSGKRIGELTQGRQK